MKKILALLLAAMMVIPMAACNQAQSDGSTPSSSTPSGLGLIAGGPVRW